MSCERNRYAFLSAIAPLLGLDAAQAEKIYQAGRMRGNHDVGTETQKTHRLFDDMRALNIKPPTHSKDGLPKMTARAGYAALYDYIIANAKVTIPDAAMQVVENGQVMIGKDLLIQESGCNAAGYLLHYRRPVTKEHVWFPNTAPSPADQFGARAKHYRLKKKEQQQYEERFVPDEHGIYPDGLGVQGFDKDGFDELGFSIYGLTREEMADANLVVRMARWKRYIQRRWVSPGGVKQQIGFSVDVEGFADDGYEPAPWFMKTTDRLGFDREGFRNGRSWTGYDENGIDIDGNPAPELPGYDGWGYDLSTGLTAPDAQGRRYNVFGWVYDPLRDECVNPDNPKQKMPNEFRVTETVTSGGYRVMKVMPLRGALANLSEQERIERIKNPHIRLQETRKAGVRLTPYLANQSDRARQVLLIWGHPKMRYLRSEMRLEVNPQASFGCVHIRCPHCGQFTGASPHVCPQFDSKNIITTVSGHVVAMEENAFDLRKPPRSPFAFYCGNILRKKMDGKAFPSFGDEVARRLSDDKSNVSKAGSLGDVSEYVRENYAGSSLPFGSVAGILYNPDPERVTPVLLVNPDVDEFDADFEGGRFPGFHWRSGISKEGYTPIATHYLTGVFIDGSNMDDAIQKHKITRLLSEVQEKWMNSKRLLETTYSRIATNIAGAPRRVDITEDGPHAGMFWTNMKGKIQGERFPLGKSTDVVNNLLALKAGIYHEIGHEEDTSPEIFSRVLRIANGEEEIEGVPREAAGIVAEIYNILEDGRMERQQAKRRRGVANILAADASIQPRWDEKVGEEFPLQHQLMGMMLYRALPFFQVRQDVYESAPVRVRDIFDRVLPLVDKAMLSPQDAFTASIGISRILIDDEDMNQFARQMTKKKSQGGKWADAKGENGQGTYVRISALPEVGSDVKPDDSLPVPAPEQNQGKSGHSEHRTPKNGEQHGAGERHQAQQADGRNSTAEKQQAQQGKRQRITATGKGSSSKVVPEPDSRFFSSVMEQNPVGTSLTDLHADIQMGKQALERTPAGKMLSRPSSSIPGGLSVLVKSKSYHVRIAYPKDYDLPRAQRNRDEMEPSTREEGRKIARRLENLQEQVRRKIRMQTSGKVDRRRIKRAVGGSKAVYSRSRMDDVTSLAVSIQLDMSGSMSGHIRSGRLAGAALALETALQRLDAEYMVAGFGTDYVLQKSFGDQKIPLHGFASLTEDVLGGTVGAPGMRLALQGLRERKSNNKLHVVMTDGVFEDYKQMKAEARKMRQGGILPFGIHFGSSQTWTDTQMDAVFGEGNWVNIQHLSDMSGVVAKRIEQIYRRILATG